MGTKSMRSLSPRQRSSERRRRHGKNPRKNALDLRPFADGGDPGYGDGALHAAAKDRRRQWLREPHLRAGGRDHLALDGGLFLGDIQRCLRRAVRQLRVYISLLGIQLHDHRLPVYLPCDADGVHDDQRDEHADQKAGAAAHRNRKGSRARQSPARDVARYPHAADEHRRQHRRDPRKRGFVFSRAEAPPFGRRE